jgi:molecular chaperone Hsp33
MSGGRPANSNEITDDVAVPFMLDAFGIHGRCVGLSETVNTILTGHSYPERAAQLLGELLILTSMIGSMLKLKGTLTVQMQGDGDIRFLTADYTEGGTIRGYAHIENDENLKSAKQSKRHEQNIAKYFGKGFVVITVEEPKMTPYQAVVPLEGKSLTACILEYFKQSNQMNCVIESVCQKVEDGWKARGILVQKLAEQGGKGADIMRAKTPEEKQEDWNTAKTILASITDEELLDESLTPNDLLFRLFHDYGIRVFDPVRIAHTCRCSREKMQAAALTLAAADLERLADGDEISMSCHFCNREEEFSLQELLAKKNN